ncbi:hypothetical protein D3273_25305 [Lichenibacterium minor]|uniref:Uncharacterized protein n=1 Tax=Lichenibacterium minor TaxID=2316528 RepID=A0A4Q2U380_9HYPH|nr:hypothetical protein [Lichenibacterium minor]RYC29185.1 hypothetical protein D3273_25305 [Lichenibacterium minor]
MADDEEDEFEVMAAALAEGAEVGFCRPGGPHDGVEDVSLRRHGDAFIAKRIDGTTLGVFASLTSALEAIEGELTGADDEA